MKRLITILMGSAAILISATVIRAQDQLVPAGTLLQCTLDEPNFSSKTAAIGDPVLCHLRTQQEFGHTLFPRGSMLGGHLEADKDPGHFVGKGYLRITFDRVILPYGDMPVPAKVIQARGYKVDKEGDIDGKGHATRDVVEWMLPPLWPWKILTLPARGPRPTLKGEEPLELRLMDDIVIPRSLALNPHLDRPPYARPSSYNATPTFEQPNAIELAVAQSRKSPAGATPSPSSTVLQAAQLSQASAPRQAPLPEQPRQVQASDRFTILVLNSNQVIEVAKYHREGDYLIITDTQGRSGSVEVKTIDWIKTTEMTQPVRSADTRPATQGDTQLPARQLN
ncbi:MAG: hypothetical protein ABSG69_15950 [Candidatus Acidiferrum sp.]|jgi:hypothetical protein